MTPREYTNWGNQYWKNVDPGVADLHAVLGVCSEAGELADLYKKLLSKGKEVTEAQVIDELGDLCYYMARLINAAGSSWEEVFALNRVKLDHRMVNGKDKIKEAQLQQEYKHVGSNISDLLPDRYI